MVRFANLEISKTNLALRIMGGLVLAGLVLFLFYYLPAHLTSLLSPYIPQQYMPYVSSFVSELISPGIPFLGVLLAIFTFFDVFLRRTWTYGVILIITGVLFLAYDTLLFRGGVYLLSGFPMTPEESAIYQQILPELTIILIVLIASSLISIVRGVALIARRNKSGMGAMKQASINQAKSN